jgi:hypothetical protein
MENPMPVCQIESADGHAVIAEYVDGKNAPILAAAPDMLAALETVAGLRGFEENEPYAKQVRAAIAKAGGAS